MKKKNLIFCLMATTMLSANFINNAYAACANDQSCGTNCCWDITDGVLRISVEEGATSGAIDNYPDYENPWYEESCTSVVIEGQRKDTDGNPIANTGITSIGDGAFMAIPVSSITIPDSVTSIGKSAFEDSGLQSITIPDSVTSIGERAFALTMLLESVTIPDSITSIGDYLFAESGLKSITIPDSVTSIGKAAFIGCNQLTAITIPDSVTSIADWAFDTTALQSIIIPDSVTSIGEEVFFETNDLKSIVIPDSVTFIGEGAFDDIYGLEKLYCPTPTSGQSICSGKGADDKIVEYERIGNETDGYLYKVGDDYFASVAEMQSETSCGTQEQCAAVLALRASQSKVTKEYNEKDGSYTIKDADGNIIGFKGKRIYTIDEANQVTGPKNRVSIKYR